MWSWSAWKERLNWLHSFWQKWKPTIPSRLIVSAAGLALAALLIVAYRTWPEPLDWLENGHEGKIIINSPTVYTRQRLVNDRLSQTQWLHEQLKAAEDVGDSPKFRSIDQVRHRYDDRLTQLGASNTGPLTKAASEQNPTDQKPSESQASRTAEKMNSSAEDVSVAPTTIELFRAKNAFRNLVRTEIMQTDLDDRHDIQGNTVYRLAFDATILAGTRKDSLAVINVILSHEPKVDAERDLFRADYEQLYSDWVRYMQNFLSESGENIANLLMSGTLEPRLKSLISRFMVGRVCEFLSGDHSLNARIARRCDPGAEDNAAEPGVAEKARFRAERFIKSYIDLHITYQEKITEGEFKKALSEKVNSRFREALSQKEIPKEFKDAFASIYSIARNLCRTRQIVGVVDLSIPEKYLEVPPKTDLPEPTGGLAPDPNAPRGEPISCPKNISTNVRLIAEIFLYNQMLDLLSADMVSADMVQESPKSKLSAESLSLDSIRRGCLTSEGENSNDINFSKCAPLTLEFPDALCFAVDFLRANLNAFDRPQALDSQRIGFFLNLDIVGREVKDCRLSVSRNDSNKASSELLREYLNKNTEVFSYGVSPKSLSQNIAVASEVRDAFQMIASVKLGSVDRYPEGFANELRRHTDQVEAIQNHPIVVGFGSGRPITYADAGTSGSPSAIVNQTTFGWIVAPQYVTNKDPQQIDAQYDLAAVVSVPSWWRSARLDIQTCWVSRKDLQLSRQYRGGQADLSKVDQTEICKGDDVQPVTLNVRLPGMIQELSRKLGFEALQEPYLSGAQKFQVLQIGQPGSLLLTGGRLWRSTEVTLGAQRADAIVVLPNMEGIIARFNCVEPQWGQYGGQSNPAVGAAQRTPAEAKTPPPPAMPATVGKMAAGLSSNTKGTNPYSNISTATNTIVRVWTSEGVAETDTVSLMWPNLWTQEHPESQERPEQGTSSGNPVPRIQTAAVDNFRDLLDKTRICPDKSAGEMPRRIAQ
jgi:hypothetical protein